MAGIDGGGGVWGGRQSPSPSLSPRGNGALVLAGDAW